MRENASAVSFLLLLPLAATALLCVAVLRRGQRSTLGNLFLATLAFEAVWITAHFFELLLDGRPSSEFWKQVKYLGVGPLPPIVFALALVFSGHRRWLKPWLVVVLVLSALIGFVSAATDELHHLFFTAHGLFGTPDRPLFWLLVITSYLYVLAASVLLARDALRRNGSHRRNGLLLAGSFLIPLMGNVLDGFGIIWPADATAFVMAVPNALLLLSVVRYRLLDVAAMGRRGVVDMMNDGVLVLDVEGRIVDANLAAARLLGATSPEAVLGRFFGDLVGQEFASIGHATGVWAYEGRDGDASNTQSVELVAAIPSRRALLVETYPVASQGECVGRVVVLREAEAGGEDSGLARPGERHRARRGAAAPIDLRHIRKDVVLTGSQGKLASDSHDPAGGDELLSVAAHELRTPLTVIRGYAQALLHDVTPDWKPDQVRSLRAIERQANRMLVLVDELLDMSRVEIGRLGMNPEPTLVVSFLREVVEEARMVNPSHRIAFSSEPSMERLVALWDPSRVEQVMVNLIQNAVKFSPPASEVAIRARAGGGLVEVSVHDQGRGIPWPEQPLVFERYYQAEEIDGKAGLGLGLHIAREIIRAHGGELRVVSEPGQGSAFHFTLPLGYDPSAELD